MYIKSKKIHYFDYASATPVDKRVFKAMKPFFAEEYGNPANLYSMGYEAKKAIVAATKKITDVLGCKSEELIFTASATESNNLAVIGTAQANRGQPSGSSPRAALRTRRAALGHRIPSIIVSNVEHKSVLAACDAIAKEGFEIVELKIEKNGLVDCDKLEKIIDDKTILVSIVYADSETGTIQPIKKIGKVIAEFRKKHTKNLPYFHTDAAQATNFLDINVNNLGVDLMTLSSPKIYGPKGMGGLYIRHETVIQPIILGGGQQFNIRSGTENVPGIVGFGEAFKIARGNTEKEQKRLASLRDRLELRVLKNIERATINGNQENRLPNFTNISIPDTDGETLILRLDNIGIVVNTGSACNSQNSEPSYILKAFGLPDNRINGSLRFTLGRHTTRKDVDYVIKTLPSIVKRLGKFSS